MGFQCTKGAQKGCRKGVLAQKGGCTKGAQRVLEGCRKGARTPLPARGGSVEKPGKRTVLDKSENQPPKGRNNVVIGPKPLFSHTRW